MLQLDVDRGMLIILQLTLSGGQLRNLSVLFVILSLACDSGEKDDTDQETDTASDSLPLPESLADFGFCNDKVLSDFCTDCDYEQYDDTYFFFATNVWTGDFEIAADGTVSGKEVWHFYPKAPNGRSGAEGSGSI